jgi:hypothetical protein
MDSQEKSVSDDMSGEKISSKKATKRAKMRAVEAKAPKVKSSCRNCSERNKS